jgi:predicted transcriptional regulator
VGFRLRSGKKGLELRLHDLEAAIMDVVWSRQMSLFAVSDVLAVLEQKRDIAYTTVMTTVVRLYDKGLLAREREGRRYLYTPKLTREQFLESTARHVLEQAVEAPQAMALLAEKLSVASAAELDELEALIRTRRRELKS